MEEREARALNVFRGEERDWTTQYAALGEFVVEFEWICWQVRNLINIILQLHGLNNWRLGEIILNQTCFSADPLGSCLSGMVGEILSGDSDVMAKMNDFRNGFPKLCKIRNDLLHASWLIGPDVVEVTDSVQPTEIHGERRTPNKHGANRRSIRTIDQIKAHINEAKRLKEVSKSLTSAVVLGLHKHETARE
jgi:hypothetical protein